jgi:hypothetical protein
MALRRSLQSPTVLGLLASMLGLCWATWGCGNNSSDGAGGNGGVSPATGGASSTGAAMGSGGAGAGTTGGASTGGAASGGALMDCTPEAIGEQTHSVGNYDNLSCNKANCHAGWVGGWVYASAKGYPWVAGATVTIINQDGTKISAVSGPDGFFYLGDNPQISSPYTTCASKCPSVDCNLTTHTSVDCLSANCHALKSQRIYVTTPNAGTGGSGPVPGENCAQPAAGGPYTHVESIYNRESIGQSCYDCHTLQTPNASPNYKGGYLYDGPASTTTVEGATITLTPTDGSPALTAITGPDGMFFFGRDGTTTTADELPAGYVPCVSKCPTSAICSTAADHPTNQDCGDCHGVTTGAPGTTGKVYLQ